jgi:hypothetical protein
MADYENRVMLKVKKNSGSEAAASRFSFQDAAQGDVRSESAATSQSGVAAGTTNGGGPEDGDFNNDNTVKFHATPQIQESANSNWSEISDNRAPASILTYMGSPSRTFSINAKFISRTKKEADRTFRYVNLLRSWRMPFIEGGRNLYVAEPEVLHLFGYGNTFRGIPVVLQSLNIELNDEVDYIKATNNTDIPIIWPVSMTLKEIHTIADFANFDIISFSQGNLPWW